ncbi:MAG: hypothetical protein D6797_00630, partial [Bdellovibrio sp.]
SIVAHFFIFLITYVFLSKYIFNPYLKAYVERVRRTRGNKEKATEILEEVKAKEQEFQDLARRLNAEYKEIYDSKKIEALKEQQKMLLMAKDEQKEKYEQVKEKVQAQLELARRDLDQEAQKISEAIVRKLSSESAVVKS